MSLNSENKTKFFPKGVLFVKIQKELSKFIENVNQIIYENLDKKGIDLNKLKKNEYDKCIYKIQEKINLKYGTAYFFKNHRFLFESIFKKSKFYIQPYFYLRAIKPSNKKNPPPVNFHRESFFGPDFYKHLLNLWIPIKNYQLNNSMYYYPSSHLYERYKDFDILNKKTLIKKKSYAHKTGFSYEDKVISFKKKINPKRLYKKNHIIFFSGQTLHGNAINLTKKIRMSLDMRFILSTNLVKNPIQSATGKKFFLRKLF